MLLASVILTWIALFLTMAAPPRSPQLRAAKLFLALAFAWLAVEGIRYGMLLGDMPAGRG